MNARSDFIQAIRGPILLITLGTLVALDYFAGWSFGRRTWPVLLIVFGLMKLLERSVRPVYDPSAYPAPYPPNPPVAGGNSL